MSDSKRIGTVTSVTHAYGVKIAWEPGMRPKRGDKLYDAPGAIEAIVRDCAARCERRAQSLREGAAVARQCGQDILVGYGLEPQ